MVEQAPLTLGQIGRGFYKESMWEYLRGKRAEALKYLFEFEASELRSEQRNELETFVEDWEGMSVVAEQQCGWCRGQIEDMHLLKCPGHPAMASVVRHEAELAALGMAPGLATELRMDADACAIALTLLVGACINFFNAMRDGDDGKSLSNPEIEATWTAARKHARSVLTGPTPIK